MRYILFRALPLFVFVSFLVFITTVLHFRCAYLLVFVQLWLIFLFLNMFGVVLEQIEHLDCFGNILKVLEK